MQDAAGSSRLYLTQQRNVGPPQCGKFYDQNEPDVLVLEMLVAWEVGAARVCAEDGNRIMACRHWAIAMKALDKMYPHLGDVRASLRTLMRRNAC
jgi:hypothetical protein